MSIEDYQKHVQVPGGTLSVGTQRLTNLLTAGSSYYRRTKADVTRYEVGSLYCTSFPDTAFFEDSATELDRRLEAGYLTSYQFCPYGGTGSAFHERPRANSYSWREDTLCIVDDWLWARPLDAEAAGHGHHAFHERMRRSHRLPDRCTWMTTNTNGPRSTSDLDSQWEAYFPSRPWYDRLRHIKHRVDPGNLFAGRMTIVGKVANQ